MAAHEPPPVRPRAVLTEILGILVPDVWGRAADQLADQTGINPRSLRAAFDARMPAFERGGEDLESFYREVALATDLSIGLEAFSRVVLDTALELVPENYRYYQELRRDGKVRMVAVSNIPGPVYEALDQKFQIGSIFDDTILSYRDEMAKPNAQIYIEAIERAGVPPSSILYVDVDAENIGGAHEWGLRTVRVTDPKDLIRAIAPQFEPAP